MTLVAGSTGHRRAKIYTAANPAGAHVTGGRLVTVIADCAVAGDRIAAKASCLVAHSGVVALVAGSAGHRRAKIYTAANSAGAHITGGCLVAVVAERTVAGDRIAAKASCLVAGAGKVALVAGRAAHRRAEIYTAANAAGAHITGGGRVTVIADRAIAGNRIAASARRRGTSANVVALVAGRADNRV